MPLNPEIFTTTGIKRSTLDKLRSNRVHDRQPDYELIDNAVEKAELYDRYEQSMNNNSSEKAVKYFDND